jgi:DNA repair protein RadC
MNVIDLYEEFKILFLNRALHVLGVYTLSKGGTAGTVVDLKLMFSTALKVNACSVIIAHNHPSGVLKPSSQDIAITKRAVEFGKLVEIVVLEHLIVGRGGYYSFANEGLI